VFIMLRVLALACAASLLTAACDDRAGSGTAPHAEAPDATLDTAPEPEVGGGPLSDGIADMLPLHGSGHEPSWHVHVERDSTTIYRRTGPLVSFPTRQPGDSPARFQFDDPEGTAHVVFEREICRDIATGMPRPYTVSAQAGADAFEGCGGDPETLFANANWTMALLGEEALTSDRDLSIRFEDGRVFGASGCNRFSGGYRMTGETLTLTGLAVSRMACLDGVMAQETRILEILTRVSMFDLTEDGALVLRTGLGDTITAYRSE
jgi:heat shock protein HslJ